MTDQIKTPPPAADADAAADALAGTTIGRFAISQRLGAGGMGQVYGAEDTTLRRKVAIKRMAPHAKSSEADRKRLLKEAQRASALNHPNVGGIYDVFEHTGELWLVMEYVEGETLRQRLKQPISTEEFFSIAIQCCEGLQAAHEKGIIHGDIKPDNIMIAPGNRVKILDFGVARRRWSSSPSDVTKTMETMVATGGTPAYMAPEVLLQRPDDGRSDIFSLGLVFYEMLGGAQPFQSDSLATTVARIVHEEPPTLKNVPGPLAAVITRALAKKPEERYPTVDALLEDLRRAQQGLRPKRTFAVSGAVHQYRLLAALAVVLVVVAAMLAFRPLRQLLRSSGGASPSQPSSTQALPQTKILAVLPYAAANSDPKLAALGEGLVANIAAKLSKLSEDRAFEVVTPRILQEKKISQLPDAARMFGANLGLAITLEPQSATLLKVTYSLLNPSGATVGGSVITVPTGDAFSVEQIISDGTVKALHLQLRPEEQATLKYHGTDQATAYEYYLQAEGYLLDASKAENRDNAELMAREALKLDPNFGMAKAAVGEAEWLKYTETKQKQWIDPAQTACNEAIKLGNAGAAGHVCLARIDDGTGHYAEAVAEYQLALGLEPSNEDAAVQVAAAYAHEGKITEAENAYQQAIQAHPNSRLAYNLFGVFYRERNEYDKALQMFGKVIQIAPDWYGTYVNIGAIYNDMGQYGKAIDPLKKSIAIRASYPGYVNLGMAYAGLRQWADAVSAYQEAIKLDPQPYVTWGNLGGALYYGGQKAPSVAPHRKAVELALEELKVNPRDPLVLSTLAGYYSMLDDRQHALEYMRQALEYGRNDKEILLDAAGVYNQLGDTGLAIEWLGKAVQAGFTTDRIRSDPEFDNLANTAGYQQLMKSSHP
jgi:serine/threonine protein kinase/tetratricopeptide (TPR) repeat protein